MTHQSKKQVYALLDRIATNESCNFAHWVSQYVALEDWIASCPADYMFEEACHRAMGAGQIRLGDVLAKLHADGDLIIENRPLGNLRDPRSHRMLGKAERLILAWAQCGIDKSLQQIEAESGWEEKNFGIYKTTPIGNIYQLADYQEILKSPEARALFELLDQLFPAK